MNRFQFQTKLCVPRPREEVFEFFSDALDLERITPPWLQFRVGAALSVRGPAGSGSYRLWIHELRFSEDSTGTACEDHVQYAPPGGALINVLFVERDIRNIFSYRIARLREIFDS